MHWLKKCIIPKVGGAGTVNRTYKKTTGFKISPVAFKMKNVADLSPKEFKEFLNSFDTIVSDIDGVYSFPAVGVIPNAAEAVKEFRKLNKKVLFASNNTFRSQENYIKKIASLGGSLDDTIYPSVLISWYLKKINFQKKAFVLGTSALRDYLEKEGIRLADRGPDTTDNESVEESVKQYDDDLDIGAVILDVDVRLNFVRLNKAFTYLKRPDCLFITGCTDMLLPLTPENIYLGNVSTKILEIASGRKTTIFGKPGIGLHQYLTEKYSVNPSRALFIGDTLLQDIYFGNQFGYKTLLVLTGANSLEDAQKAEGDYRPQYYINSLGDIYSLLKNESPN